MSQFSFDDLVKKDIISALKLWAFMEVGCFLIFPILGVIDPGPRLQSWFLFSIPAGLVGAFLVGVSSKFVSVTNERNASTIKRIELITGQAIGWIGLMGVAFPLLMVGIEFLAKLFDEIQNLPTSR